ncbi:hypothetical protein KUCAC02_020824, partial [Chaenocephalus aceratus]
RKLRIACQSGAHRLPVWTSVSLLSVHNRWPTSLVFQEMWAWRREGHPGCVSKERVERDVSALRLTPWTP